MVLHGSRPEQRRKSKLHIVIHQRHLSGATSKTIISLKGFFREQGFVFVVSWESIKFDKIICLYVFKHQNIFMDDGVAWETCLWYSLFYLSDFIEYLLCLVLGRCKCPRHSFCPHVAHHCTGGMGTGTDVSNKGCQGPWQRCPGFYVSKCKAHLIQPEWDEGRLCVGNGLCESLSIQHRVPWIGGWWLSYSHSSKV